MKHFSLLAATLAFSLALPAWAQTQIEAPNGWKTQTRAQGAVTFTPPNLRAGEKYSVTVYDAVSLGGKTPGEYLRQFAGPVGSGAGELRAPLQIKVQNASVISGFGAYNGPKGANLGVVFFGVSPDGANIHVGRVLFSSDDLFLNRYKAEWGAVLGSLAQRARDEASGNVVNVPPRVLEHLTPGGALVPGVYAGNQYDGTELRYRLRVYLYPDGEYRICDEKDADFQDNHSQIMGTGEYGYNRSTGQLSLDRFFDLSNSASLGGSCFFGRDAQNKPLIIARDGAVATELRFVGAPTKRPSPKAERTRQAAIRAEERRYKFVALPGRGLKDAQIAAILQGGGFEGREFVNHTYLLLRDGTVHAELPPVALDQFNFAASKQKEPEAWGRWRRVKGKYEVSWEGKPFEELQAGPALPAPVGLRLNSRFEGASASQFSYQIFGVTFDKTGRFSRDSRGGVSVGPGAGGVEGSVTATTTWDEGGVGSTTSVAGGASTQGGTLSSSVSKKKNPRGNREGTYSFNGYTLTLRYDNGQVERIPTFLIGEKREMLWFDGAVVMDRKK